MLVRFCHFGGINSHHSGPKCPSLGNYDNRSGGRPRPTSKPIYLGEDGGFKFGNHLGLPEQTRVFAGWHQPPDCLLDKPLVTT